MFHKKTIDDVDLTHKTILYRPEFNVPVKDGKVTDDYRIEKAMPTLKKLLDSDCKVVIVCNLGRPKGQVVPKLSQEPVANRLGELIDADVAFVDALYGDQVKQAVKRLQGGNILMLQNMRFDPRENANDPEFARLIVDSISPDMIVQDAFGNAHRKYATMHGINQFAPSVSGYLIRDELTAIGKAISHPEHPLVTVIGGTKLETKLPLINNFMRIAQTIVIGGVMANTFLKASGYNIGSSVYEEGDISSALAVMSAAKAAGVAILMPLDGVAVGNSFDNPGPRREVSFDQIGPDDVILDYGQKSIDSLLQHLDGAQTIIWNGPLGVTEYDDFAIGSRALADFIASRDVYSVVGGGDTVGYIDSIKYMDKFTHVSTGGGASLELMAGNPLPAVEALMDK